MKLVGVSDTRRVSRKTMSWLSSGGREKIYGIVRRLEKKLQKQGRIEDFHCSIVLPHDVFFCEKYNDGIMRLTLIEVTKKRPLEYWQNLAKKMTKEANIPEQKVFEKLKHGKVLNYRATVKTGKEVFRLADNEIYTDFSWHGDEGAAIIFETIDRLIEKNCAVETASCR
jgi:hypothetical protein